MTAEGDFNQANHNIGFKYNDHNVTIVVISYAMCCLVGEYLKGLSQNIDLKTLHGLIVNVSHLDTQLWYSTGMFQVLQLIVLAAFCVAD